MNTDDEMIFFYLNQIFERDAESHSLWLFMCKHWGEPKTRERMGILEERMQKYKAVKPHGAHEWKLSDDGRQIQLKGGWLKHLALIEVRDDLELRKLRLEVEVNEKIVRDYPITKIISWVGFAMAVILAIVEIIQYIEGK